MIHFNFQKSALLLLAIITLGAFSANAQLSGTYTIAGTNPDYATLSDAVGDLNTSGVNGPVIFNIRDGSYTGSNWQVTIGNISGASSTNTITIKSQSNDATKVSISAAGSSSNNHVILFDGAKYVKVLHLSLANTNASNNCVVRFSGTAEFDNVENCVLTGLTTTSNSGDRTVVRIGHYGVGDYFQGNDITIKNNTIKNGSCAVSVCGQSTSTLTDNITIDGNTVTGSYYYIFYTYYAGNLKLNNNDVNVTSNGLYYPFYFYYNGDGMEVTGNTAVLSTKTTQYTIYIYGMNSVVGSATTPALFKNNDFTVTSTSTLYGIYNYNDYYLDFSENDFDVTGSSTTYFPYYLLYYCSDSKANENNFKVKGTSTLYAPYFAAYNSTNVEVAENVFDVTGSSTTYAPYYFSYYNYTSVLKDNVFDVYTTGTAASPYYTCYYGDDNVIENNEFNVQNTTGTAYVPYFMSYNGNDNLLKGNTFNLKKTSGTTYTPYYLNAYGAGNVVDDNEWNVTRTTGSNYVPYYGVYNTSGSAARNNRFNVNASSSSTVYASYYLNYLGSLDTFEENVYNINTTGTIYSYKYYLSNLTRNNTFNFKTTSGTIYNYFYYNAGGDFLNNKMYNTSTTGTIYGCYFYYNSPGGGMFANNVFDSRSNSGTVYGMYSYYQNNDDVIGNVISTKTSGTSYLFYASSGIVGDSRFYNNTFHSNATGSTNYLMYFSGSNNGKGIFKNNVFSRSKDASNGVYISNASKYEGDYNNFYTATSTTPKLQCGSPSFSTTQLQEWRQKTNSDMNSLSFAPGYSDEAGFDFRPDASNPDAWSLQGRGTHLANDTLDILGNPRAKVPADGVPDIGAYEFTPTSIPHDADAYPSSPLANSMQYFLFGQDTVGAIEWGASVPSTFTMKQYTGLKANPILAAVGRMFFFTTMDAGGDVDYAHKAHIRYKDPWIGNVSSETNARIAKSTGSTPWAGYNYTNGITDTVMNVLSPANDFDSLGKYTGVENARIGIRCVVEPENIQTSNITAFVADIAWDPIFNPIGYEIIVNTSSATPTAAQAAAANFTATNSYTAGVPTALTEDTRYYIHIRSICGAKDTSGWALDSFMTLITCHSPNVQITAVNSNRAVAYWDTVKTGIAYEYAIDQSPTPPAFGTSIPNNSLLVPYLLSNTTYYMHVKSYCSSIYSESGWTTVPFTTWPLDVNNVNGEAMNIVAYPNPVTDVLHVQILGSIADNAVVELEDITGKLIQRVAVGNDKVDVNVSEVSAGVYMLRYRDDNRTEVIKVTKQ